MSGKTSGLTALESRKQLLLMESELNRAHLIQEWHELKNSVDHYVEQARAVGSIANSAARITSAIGGFFTGSNCSNHDDGEKKSSFLSTVFKGARAGISLWANLRSRLR